MRKFIKDVWWCLLVFITAAILCEVAFNYIPNNYSYKYNYVTKHREDISVLLVGHSQVLRGINPSILGDSVFNFSESARWIYYDAKILEHFVPQMPNLRVVIYPICYDMPYGYSSYHYEQDCNLEEDHAYQIHMYAKYQHIPYDRFPQCYISYSALLSGFFSKDEIRDIDCDSLGFERQSGVLHWGDNWQNGEKVHFPSGIIEADYRTNKYVMEYIDYLTQMAKICDKYNVRFVTITTPCHQLYVDETTKIGMMNIDSMVEDVAKSYPIEYYNYLDDKDFRSDSLFLDCLHLNYIGSDKFTLRLKQDLGL